MKNKYLIELKIPELDKKYDIFVPVNKKLFNVIDLILKSIYELNNLDYSNIKKRNLINKYTGEVYNVNKLIRDTSIKNGTCLILI